MSGDAMGVALANGQRTCKSLDGVIFFFLLISDDDRHVTWQG